MEVSRLNPRNWFRDEYDRDWPSRGAITPWHGSDAFGSLSQLRRDIDRLFDDTFRGSSWPSWPRRSDLLPSLANENVLLSPSVDIVSTDKEYRITVEVPGVEEKDIKLESSGDTLTIRGEKKQERKEEKADIYCTECAYGSFERTLTLPEDANADKVDASFRNGVLTITIPRERAAKAPTRKIPVKHAA
jgi:HSP20 family protein